MQFKALFDELSKFGEGSGKKLKHQVTRVKNRDGQVTFEDSSSSLAATSSSESSQSLYAPKLDIILNARRSFSIDSVGSSDDDGLFDSEDDDEEVVSSSSDDLLFGDSPLSSALSSEAESFEERSDPLSRGISDGSSGIRGSRDGVDEFDEETSVSADEFSSSRDPSTSRSAASSKPGRRSVKGASKKTSKARKSDPSDFYRYPEDPPELTPLSRTPYCFNRVSGRWELVELKSTHADTSRIHISEMSVAVITLKQQIPHDLSSYDPTTPSPLIGLAGYAGRFGRQNSLSHSMSMSRSTSHAGLVPNQVKVGAYGKHGSSPAYSGQDSNPRSHWSHRFSKKTKKKGKHRKSVSLSPSVSSTATSQSRSSKIDSRSAMTSSDANSNTDSSSTKIPPSSSSTAKSTGRGPVGGRAAYKSKRGASYDGVSGMTTFLSGGRKKKNSYSSDQSEDMTPQPSDVSLMKTSRKGFTQTVTDGIARVSATGARVFSKLRSGPAAANEDVLIEHEEDTSEEMNSSEDSGARSPAPPSPIGLRSDQKRPMYETSPMKMGGFGDFLHDSATDSEVLTPADPSKGKNSLAVTSPDLTSIKRLSPGGLGYSSSGGDSGAATTMPSLIPSLRLSTSNSDSGGGELTGHSSPAPGRKLGLDIADTSPADMTSLAHVSSTEDSSTMVDSSGLLFEDPLMKKPQKPGKARKSSPALLGLSPFIHMRHAISVSDALSSRSADEEEPAPEVTELRKKGLSSLISPRKTSSSKKGKKSGKKRSSSMKLFGLTGVGSSHNSGGSGGKKKKKQKKRKKGSRRRFGTGVLMDDSNEEDVSSNNEDENGASEMQTLMKRDHRIKVDAVALLKGLSNARTYDTIAEGSGEDTSEESESDFDSGLGGGIGVKRGVRGADILTMKRSSSAKAFGYGARDSLVDDHTADELLTGVESGFTRKKLARKKPVKPKSVPKKGLKRASVPLLRLSLETDIVSAASVSCDTPSSESKKRKRAALARTSLRQTLDRVNKGLPAELGQLTDDSADEAAVSGTGTTRTTVTGTTGTGTSDRDSGYKLVTSEDHSTQTVIRTRTGGKSDTSTAVAGDDDVDLFVDAMKTPDGVTPFLATPETTPSSRALDEAGGDCLMRNMSYGKRLEVAAASPSIMRSPTSPSSSVITPHTRGMSHSASAPSLKMSPQTVGSVGSSSVATTTTPATMTSTTTTTTVMNSPAKVVLSPKSVSASDLSSMGSPGKVVAVQRAASSSMVMSPPIAIKAAQSASFSSTVLLMSSPVVDPRVDDPVMSAIWKHEESKGKRMSLSLSSSGTADGSRGTNTSSSTPASTRMTQAKSLGSLALIKHGSGGSGGPKVRTHGRYGSGTPITYRASFRSGSDTSSSASGGTGKKSGGHRTPGIRRVLSDSSDSSASTSLRNMASSVARKSYVSHIKTGSGCLTGLISATASGPGTPPINSVDILSLHRSSSGPPTTAIIVEAEVSTPQSVSQNNSPVPDKSSMITASPALTVTSVSSDDGRRRPTMGHDSFHLTDGDILSSIFDISNSHSPRNSFVVSMPEVTPSPEMTPLVSDPALQPSLAPLPSDRSFSAPFSSDERSMLKSGVIKDRTTKTKKSGMYGVKRDSTDLTLLSDTAVLKSRSSISSSVASSATPSPSTGTAAATAAKALFSTLSSTLSPSFKRKPDKSQSDVFAAQNSGSFGMKRRVPPAISADETSVDDGPVGSPPLPSTSHSSSSSSSQKKVSLSRLSKSLTPTPISSRVIRKPKPKIQLSVDSHSNHSNHSNKEDRWEAHSPSESFSLTTPVVSTKALSAMSSLFSQVSVDATAESLRRQKQREEFDAMMKWLSSQRPAIMIFHGITREEFTLLMTEYDWLKHGYQCTDDERGGNFDQWESVIFSAINVRKFEVSLLFDPMKYTKQRIEQEAKNAYFGKSNLSDDDLEGGCGSSRILFRRPRSLQHRRRRKSRTTAGSSSSKKGAHESKRGGSMEVHSSVLAKVTKKPRMSAGSLQIDMSPPPSAGESSSDTDKKKTPKTRKDSKKATSAVDEKDHPPRPLLSLDQQVAISSGRSVMSKGRRKTRRPLKCWLISTYIDLGTSDHVSKSTALLKSTSLDDYLSELRPSSPELPSHWLSSSESKRLKQERNTEGIMTFPLPPIEAGETEEKRSMPTQIKSPAILMSPELPGSPPFSSSDSSAVASLILDRISGDDSGSKGRRRSSPSPSPSATNTSVSALLSRALTASDGSAAAGTTSTSSVTAIALSPDTTPVTSPRAHRHHHSKMVTSPMDGPTSGVSSGTATTTSTTVGSSSKPLTLSGLPFDLGGASSLSYHYESTMEKSAEMRISWMTVDVRRGMSKCGKIQCEQSFVHLDRPEFSEMDSVMFAATHKDAMGSMIRTMHRKLHRMQSMTSLHSTVSGTDRFDPAAGSKLERYLDSARKRIGWCWTKDGLDDHTKPVHSHAPSMAASAISAGAESATDYSSAVSEASSAMWPEIHRMTSAPLSTPSAYGTTPHRPFASQKESVLLKKPIVTECSMYRAPNLIPETVLNFENSLTYSKLCDNLRLMDKLIQRANRGSIRGPAVWPYRRASQKRKPKFSAAVSGSSVDSGISSTDESEAAVEDDAGSTTTGGTPQTQQFVSTLFDCKMFIFARH